MDTKLDYEVVRNHINIKVGEDIFRISVNKFNELVINKDGWEKSSLSVTPQMANEILIK